MVTRCYVECLQAATHIVQQLKTYVQLTGTVITAIKVQLQPPVKLLNSVFPHVLLQDLCGAQMPPGLCSGLKTCFLFLY